MIQNKKNEHEYGLVLRKVVWAKNHSILN